VFVLKVEKRSGENYRTLVREAGTLHCSYRLVDEGDHILIPLTRELSLEELARMDDEVKERCGKNGTCNSGCANAGSRATILRRSMPGRSFVRKSPQETIARRLSERGLESPLLELVPAKWERLGDILVIRLDERLRSCEEEVAEAFMDVLGMRAVYVDESGIEGELREPGLRRIGGSGSRTTHPENGIRYSMDVSKVMFSSGNIDERIHFSNIDASGETVVDMFAGIGYFTLPLAVHGKPERIHAIEKNRTAFEFLRENVDSNGVGDIVKPLLGDNRDVGPVGMADRVIMGYLPTPERFIGRAFAFLREDGGLIHYHHTCLRSERRRLVEGHFRKSLSGKNAGFEIEDYRVIKSYAPMIHHCVADVRVSRHSGTGGDARE